MKKLAMMMVFFASTVLVANAQDVVGDWQGTLDVGVMKLRLVFHITNTEDGLTATMDSPDQNANGLPVTSVTRDGA